MHKKIGLILKLNLQNLHSIKGLPPKVTTLFALQNILIKDRDGEEGTGIALTNLISYYVCIKMQIVVLSGQTHDVCDNQ